MPKHFLLLIGVSSSILYPISFLLGVGDNFVVLVFIIIIFSNFDTNFQQNETVVKI